MRVVTGLAHALDVPSERLLKFLGPPTPADATRSTESVIATDERLSARRSSR